jgi:hypothetical protein
LKLTECRTNKNNYSNFTGGSVTGISQYRRHTPYTGEDPTRELEYDQFADGNISADVETEQTIVSSNSKFHSFIKSFESNSTTETN